MNDVIIKPVERAQLLDVHLLLQDVSTYLPGSSSHDLIWRSFCEQENVHGWVMLIENRVIGYGSIVLEHKIRGGRAGHIEDIVIDKEYRKLGLGQFLVNFILEFATSAGCYKVSLQCATSNQGFYRSIGFEQSGLAMQRFL